MPSALQPIRGRVEFVKDKLGAEQWTFVEGTGKQHPLKDGDILFIFNSRARNDEIARTEVSLNYDSHHIRGKEVVEAHQMTFAFPDLHEESFTTYQTIQGVSGKFNGLLPARKNSLEDETYIDEVKQWVTMFRQKKPAYLIPKT